MTRPLSMPRPTYIAAHNPAGPAPTTITSYPLITLSGIRSKFQSRGIPFPRQGPRQPRAEGDGFEFHVRPRRAGELLERAASHDLDAVGVAARAVQQRGGGLDEPLP